MNLINLNLFASSKNVQLRTTKQSQAEDRFPAPQS